MLIPLVAKIFRADKLYSMLTLNPDYAHMIKAPEGPMKLLTTEETTLNELAFFTHHIKTIDDISLFLFKIKIGVEQKKLINELKEEYHLD